MIPLFFLPGSIMLATMTGLNGLVTATMIWCSIALWVGLASHWNWYGKLMVATLAASVYYCLPDSVTQEQLLAAATRESLLWFIGCANALGLPLALCAGLEDTSSHRSRNWLSERLIRVPYAEKDEAKAMGARWHSDLRSWYLPKAKMNDKRFDRWRK